MSSKTKRVYNVEVLELLDGSEVEVRPLPIKKLRIAQDSINKALTFSGEEDSDSEDAEENMINVFLDIVETVIKVNGSEKLAKFMDPESGRDELEDTLDQDTMYEIVKVATGFDFLAMNERVQKMLDAGVTR